jgi:hypothetical protein
VSQPEPPPLAPPEARAILRRLGDLTREIVLVGGQALAFWAELYADRLALSSPVNSRDIDFGGHSDVVSIAADRLNGTWTVPEPFSISPNSGLVLFNDGEGYPRRIDFLHQVFGLDLDEIFKMAIEVEVPDHDETTHFLVMHPVHCLEARISNVGGLPGYKSAHGLTQARTSILCAREYLRDRLEGGDAAIRPVLRLNERIYRFAWGNHNAKIVFQDFGIDAFDAVLVDDRLPEPFRSRRYLQMQELLRRRRKHWIIKRRAPDGPP